MKIFSSIPTEWDEWVAQLPGAHLLQTAEWAQIKADVGWRALPVVWQDDGGNVEAAAMVLERSVRLLGLLRLRIFYVPRGPLLDWNTPDLRSRILDDLQRLARQRGAIFIKFDPDVLLGTGIPGSEDASETTVGAMLQAELVQRGWRFSTDQVQFRNTVKIDVAQTEEELLARMKQKTRYNLRLAQRKGVAVRIGNAEDSDLIYHMYAETSIRDGFVIREADYYQRIWRLFGDAGMAQPLIAEVDGEPVAAIYLFTFGGSAWYLYGMSREVHRDKMPNVLLQWEAIRWAKQRGCHTYDLWGAPDVFDESDSMWGVYRFKEGLGGILTRGLGAWDYPSRPILYKLYTNILPRILDVMRRRGKARTQQEVKA